MMNMAIVDSVAAIVQREKFSIYPIIIDAYTLTARIKIV
jgi:hypothetical protein